MATSITSPRRSGVINHAADTLTQMLRTLGTEGEEIVWSAGDNGFRNACYCVRAFLQGTGADECGAEFVRTCIFHLLKEFSVNTLLALLPRIDQLRAGQNCSRYPLLVSGFMAGSESRFCSFISHDYYGIHVLCIKYFNPLNADYRL